MHQELLLPLLWLLAWQPLPSDAVSLDIFHSDCLDESLGSRSDASSIIECVAKGRPPNRARLSVAQWNDRDTVCTLFTFQEVCQRLILAGRYDQPTPTSCRTVIGTKYNAIAASRLFVYFWAGDAGNERMESLVCGLDNRVLTKGVTWTSEGPRMDGTNGSRLWTLQLPVLGNKTTLTVVIRLKRKPDRYCYLEMTDCTEYNTMSMQILEKNYLNPDSAPNGSIYSDLALFGRSRTNPSAVPSDAERFFTLALTFSAPLYTSLPNEFDFQVLVDNSQVNYEFVQPFNYPDLRKPLCMAIGWSGSTPDLSGSINGVVAGMGISNLKLNPTDLRELFKNVG